MAILRSTLPELLELVIMPGHVQHQILPRSSLETGQPIVIQGWVFESVRRSHVRGQSVQSHAAAVADAAAVVEDGGEVVVEGPVVEEGAGRVGVVACCDPTKDMEPLQYFTLFFGMYCT